MIEAINKIPSLLLGIFGWFKKKPEPTPQPFGWEQLQPVAWIFGVTILVAFAYLILSTKKKSEKKDHEAKNSASNNNRNGNNGYNGWLYNGWLIIICLFFAFNRFIFQFPRPVFWTIFITIAALGGIIEDSKKK